MCGIAGLISPEASVSIEHVVRDMMQAMARRGLDSDGYEAWNGVGFGHRRLAILDLSAAGYQPMLTEDRSVGVVFNGCIYNFLELRSELESHGHRFRSHCDTEVLIRGYKQWGIEKLTQRLHGMFAFGIWDEPRRCLSLVRDRLGVKPLVYATRPGAIAFGSTIAAVAASGFHGAVDPLGILQFLELGNVAGDQCIFEGLRKLPPGNILQWQDGRITEWAYWSLPDFRQESLQIDFDEAVEETERLLIEATRLRLCSDVPIAALLSGGVDSTLVCWALTRLNANVTAFTVGSRGDSSDETSVARQTARLLGIPHEVVELPAERPEILETAADAFSEPFASPSAQAMLRVSRAVKSKATVLLTGDGGDDVFLGYPFFRHALLAQNTARYIPSFAAPLVRGAAAVLPMVGPLRRMRHFLGYASSGLSSYVQAGDRLPYYERYGMLGERLQGISLPHHHLVASLESAQQLLPAFLQHFYRMHFLGEFLPKVDGATMYYSVESRSPFLDQKLWEFAAKLPPELLLRGGELKAVLRQIVRKRVNPQISSRQKQGFTVPVERWLATTWTESLDILTRPNELERQGWIRPGSLAAPIAEARAKQWAPKQLWFLLLLEHWLKRQVTTVSLVSNK